MSTCSTPTPKRRRVMLSWSSIVSKIPEEMKMDGINYVSILENMEDIEVFRQINKVENKKAMLQNEFGDESPELIDKILELVVGCVS